MAGTCAKLTMMNFKYLFLIFSILFLILAYYLTTTTFFEFGFGIRAFGYYLLPIALLLLLSNKRGANKVHKISFWFIPVTLIVLLLQSPDGDVWNPLDAGMTTMGIWLGTIYLILCSFVIFLANKKK